MKVQKKRTMGPNGWHYGEKKKKTSQGCGRHTKFGKTKGRIKKYRGQGGIKSKKRH